MYATLVESWNPEDRAKGILLRCDFDSSLEYLKNRASSRGGIVAIEEIGVGIVWRREVDKADGRPPS